MRAWCLAPLLAALALACATAPPPDPQREASAAAHQMSVLREGPGVALVATLGARIATTVPGTPLRFHVVNLPEINAFSLPGGNVYVSRGLLGFVRSEAELANVLAHEVVHVTGGHAYRLERERQEIRQLLLARMVHAFMRGGPDARAALELQGAGLVARYSRDLEREADRTGQALAARAGFDPAAMARSFRPLTAEERSSVRVRRLEVLTAHAGEPFEALLERGGNVERIDRIALMNGLDVGVRLPAGRRVKVVTEAAYGAGFQPPPSDL